MLTVNLEIVTIIIKKFRKGQGAPVFVEGGRLCHGTMASPSLVVSLLTYRLKTKHIYLCVDRELAAANEVCSSPTSSDRHLDYGFNTTG